MHRSTLEDYLNKENKLYNYFTFSSSIFNGSDLDNQRLRRSLNELIELKNSLNPKIPSRGNQVKLKDLALNKELKFYSLSILKN